MQRARKRAGETNVSGLQVPPPKKLRPKLVCVQTAHTASHRDIKLAGGRHTQSVYKQTTNGQGERGRGFGGGGVATTWCNLILSVTRWY